MSFGEAFLATPDLFPGRSAGEAWGERTFALRLPGGTCRIAGLSPAQDEAVRLRFGPSIPDRAGPPDLRVFRAAESDFRAVDTRGWEYAADLGFAPGSLRVAGLRLMARLDWSPAPCASLWTPDAGSAAFAGIFENVLRLLTAYRLRPAGGAVIHSAGIAIPGWGVFLGVGPSGAGKTTLSLRARERGAVVLSDDLNAVLPAARSGRAGGGGWTAAHLPFTGDLGASPRAGAAGALTLRAVLRLEKSEEDALLPLSRAEAAATLLASAPFLNRDPYRREALLADLLELCGSVPAYALRFSLGPRVWSILETLWNPSARTTSCGSVETSASG
jgi:hypothetical protein